MVQWSLPAVMFQLGEQEFFDIGGPFAAADNARPSSSGGAAIKSRAAGQDVQVVVEVIAPLTMLQTPARLGNGGKGIESMPDA